MCFSTEASFTAGAVLTVIGVITIANVQHKNQIIFACIPIMFAFQQFTEGFVWMALSNSNYASIGRMAIYTFLIFAQVVWPILVPFSILMLEKEYKKKQQLKIFIGLGVLISIYLFIHLITSSVEARIDSSHILYVQHQSTIIKVFGSLIYVLATIIPAFISSIRSMSLFGVAILISYVISAIFYIDYMVSVWCFFASIISVMVLFILRGASRTSNKYN